MPKATDRLRIGEVARESGVGIETIRFYEREGVLDAPMRTAGGYRAYPREAVDQLKFVRRAKNLGFTLKEIRDLLSLKADPRKPCAEVDRRVAEKIEAIEAKIADLRRIQQALEQLAAACPGNASVKSCNILQALADDTVIPATDES